MRTASICVGIALLVSGLVGCEARIRDGGLAADAGADSPDSGRIGPHPGDAAPPEADAPTDAATAAFDAAPGAVSCDQLGDALVCDEFDDRLDTQRWQVRSRNGGEVSIDHAFSYSGTGSLHVRLPRGDGVQGMLGTSLSPPGNRFFGRVYLYAAQTVLGSHSYAMAAAGVLDGSRAQYRLDSNDGRLNSRYTHASVEQHGGLRKMGLSLPVGRWVCLEWRYDGADNEMQYWFDGVEEQSMRVTAAEDPPWIAPPFNSFEFGWHTFQAPSNAEVLDFWYDGLALAARRIGCGS